MIEGIREKDEEIESGVGKESGRRGGDFHENETVVKGGKKFDRRSRPRILGVTVNLFSSFERKARISKKEEKEREGGRGKD